MTKRTTWRDEELRDMYTDTYVALLKYTFVGIEQVRNLRGNSAEVAVLRGHGCTQQTEIQKNVPSYKGLQWSQNTVRHCFDCFYFSTLYR